MLEAEKTATASLANLSGAAYETVDTLPHGTEGLFAAIEDRGHLLLVLLVLMLLLT